MNDMRTLIIGIDLGNDYTQVSVYQNKQQGPEAVSFSSDKEDYLIPTCLSVKESTKDWLIGHEAIRCYEHLQGELISDLLMKLEKDETTSIYGVEFTPVALLGKFIKKLLAIIKQLNNNNSILKLAITTKHVTLKFKETVTEILKNLGLDESRIMILSNIQSFMYYTVSQRPEIWVNDVGLFHFDEEGLKYFQLTVGRKTTPAVVAANEYCLSEEFSYELPIQVLSTQALSTQALSTQALSTQELLTQELLTQELLTREEINRISYRFQELAKQVLFKKIVSTLYITGKGFEGGWADEALKNLCSGRRVFKGQNLYTKGACYAAYSTKQGLFEGQYTFLAEDMITSNIGITLHQDARETEYVLANAATPWWQVNTTINAILDNTDEICFVVSDILKRESVTKVMKLNHLLCRKNKTTRVQITMYLVNRETAIVKVKDTGFGDFYESSHRIWEQILKI